MYEGYKDRHNTTKIGPGDHIAETTSGRLVVSVLQHVFTKLVVSSNYTQKLRNGSLKNKLSSLDELHCVHFTA